MDAAELNPEVFAPRDPVVKVRAEDVAFLEKQALATRRRKCRLLLHRQQDAALHEMLIVDTKGQYIRPHINHKSSKSFHIVKGALVCVLFTDTGEVSDHCRMTEAGGDGVFMIRLSESCYHTLIPLSDTVAYVETILGPFKSTTYAAWAPEETNRNEAMKYFNGLCLKVGLDPEAVAGAKRGEKSR